MEVHLHNLNENHRESRRRIRTSNQLEDHNLRRGEKEMQGLL